MEMGKKEQVLPARAIFVQVLFLWGWSASRGRPPQIIIIFYWRDQFTAINHACSVRPWQVMLVSVSVFTMSGAAAVTIAS